MARILIRRLAVVVGLALMPAAPLAVNTAGAQEEVGPQTLADIRADLRILKREIERLRREMATTGASGVGTVDTGPVLQRLDEIETELRDTIGRVERIQFDVQRIVEDGTNRIGDLEFRLTELEGGDISALDDTEPLGGGVTDPIVEPELPGDGKQPELAVSEQSDFDAALAAYNDKKYLHAARMFETFVATYPGGPLASEAQYWRGEALAATGAWNQAARSFLDSFSGAPQGPKAPQALYRLGESLAELGQKDEACLTFSEVQVRFPDEGSGLLARSTEQMARLGCL
ncbi:MAG: tol-pal system protein YbgF [Paracoccaceae bacterium]